MTILNRLFGFSAPVDRKTYFTTGVILMAVKYGVEFLGYYFLHHHVLTPWEFISPSWRRVSDHENVNAVMAQLIFSLPFIWIGLSMSVRRAENAGRSPWWGVLFFVPLLNLVLMIVLSLLPERPNTPSPKNENILFAGVIFSMGSVVSVCFLISLFWLNVLGQYGTGLFVGAPVLGGLVGGFVLNRKRQYTVGQTLGAMLLSMIFVTGVILLAAWEGIVCLGMAAPLTIGLSLPSALLGRFLANRRKNGLLSLSPALLMIPGLLGYDMLSNYRPLYEVYSSVDIAASPEKIWPIVIEFPELSPPNEMLFRAGIAYPISARIEGKGVGAIRYCEFSTGPFVEPITAWEPNERLAFKVTKNPSPMTEFNPIWKDLDTPHLHGFMESEKGEFRLVRLPNGSTRLEGYTWYRQGIFPQVYWSQFSNEIIHQVHYRVLNHIKALAEGEAVISAER